MRFRRFRPPQNCTGLENRWVLAGVHSLPPTNLLSIGLFTSPHLVSVLERIRVNGVPISEEDFVKYFFEVWDRLEENKTVTTIPLTCLSTFLMNSFIRQNTLKPNYVPHIFVI